MEKSESKLAGSLIKKIRAREQEAPGISVGEIIIQRDGGKEFVIEKINDTPRGQRTLLRSADGSTISLAKDDLLNKLNTSGSAWKRKE